jgi:hypothetical protein
MVSNYRFPLLRKLECQGEYVAARYNFPSWENIVQLRQRTDHEWRGAHLFSNLKISTRFHDYYKTVNQIAEDRAKSRPGLGSFGSLRRQQRHGRLNCRTHFLKQKNDLTYLGHGCDKYHSLEPCRCLSAY